jgi:SulP family sulfate permease
LQRSEDVLLADAADGTEQAGTGEVLAGMPPQLRAHLERVSVPEGSLLLRQGESPDDVFVLESGRLRVEMVTPEGTRMRLRTMRAGVVVGEIALYTSAPRTADVVAETPCVVLRLSRAELERIEAQEPELAAALHRWFATTLAERLGDAIGAFDALLD